MREKKRFLLKYKREIISAIAAGMILVSVSGCAKQEETYPEIEKKYTGELIIRNEEEGTVRTVDTNEFVGTKETNESSLEGPVKRLN